MSLSISISLSLYIYTYRHAVASFGQILPRPLVSLLQLLDLPPHPLYVPLCNISIHLDTHTHIHTHVCICMYVCIYVYTHTHTYELSHRNAPASFGQILPRPIVALLQHLYIFRYTPTHIYYVHTYTYMYIYLSVYLSIYLY